MKSYVAVDLHRRRSVVMRREPDGETCWVRIDNSPQNLVEAVFEAGPDPVVAIEATLVLGRADTTHTVLGQQNQTRSDHQTRIQTPAMGRDRSDRASTQRILSL